MLILMMIASVYSLIIISTFNLLPSKWLCDYGTECKEHSLQKHISLRIYFLPVFSFTFTCIYFFLNYADTFLHLFIYISLILLLSHILLSDIFYMIIPDQHIFFIIILGILDISSQNICDKLIGFLAGALPFFLLLAIGILLKKKEYIGFGDIKLMSALGFLIGYVDILNIYILSSFLSGIFFITLTFISKILGKNLIKVSPFAPFIIFSFVFCVST